LQNLINDKIKLEKSMRDISLKNGDPSHKVDKLLFLEKQLDSLI